MSRYTPQQFEEHYKKLPPILRQALHSPDNAEKMIEMGRKHGLTIEEIGYAAEEIGFVIMGLTPARSFVSALKEHLKKSEDEIKNLAADINHQVFYPLREELKKAHDFDLTAETIQEGAPRAFPKKPPSVQETPLSSARKILESENSFPPKTPASVQTFAKRSDTEEQQIPHTGIRPIDLRKSIAAEFQEKTPQPVAPVASNIPPKPSARAPSIISEFSVPKPAPLPHKPPPSPTARPAPPQSAQTQKPDLPIPPQKAAPAQLQKSILPPYFEPISEKVPPIDLRKREQAKIEQTEKQKTKEAPHIDTQKPSAPPASLPKPPPPMNLPNQKEKKTPDWQKPAQAQSHDTKEDPYRETIGA